LAVKLTLIILGFSFFPIAALSFRYHSTLIRILYLFATLWLGLLNFIFWAAVIAWPLHYALVLMNLTEYDLVVAKTLLALAVLTTILGIINSRVIRIRRHTIKLPNLPASWHGRRIVLVTDAHLGSINGVAFSRRIVNMLTRLHPDLILIAGDLFDGNGIDPLRALKPWKKLHPPFGICFATGNHEEFGDRTPFLSALHSAGIRILDPNNVPYLQRATDAEFISSALVNLDGLQIAGVGFHDSTHPARLRATLESINIDRNAPSILLNHVPNQLATVERAGFSLMVSGHTHGGQLFPFTWFTRRIFGSFTEGHSKFGSLQTLTSLGVGSWGPPMRVGTRSEILLIHLT
jgi:predicted MPP superfamily phosphohydrolase